MQKELAVWLQQYSQLTAIPPQNRRQSPSQQRKVELPLILVCRILAFLAEQGMPAAAIPYVASKCLSGADYQQHFGLKAPADADHVRVKLLHWVRYSSPVPQDPTALADSLSTDNRQLAGPVLHLLLLSCPETSISFATTAVQQLQKYVRNSQSWTTKGAANASVQRKQFYVQHIRHLKLTAWTNFSFDNVDNCLAHTRDMQLAENLWRGMQTACICNLELGEFFSEDFVLKLPYINTPHLPSIPGAPGLQSLQILTLHLNMWGVYRVCNSGSDSDRCMSSLGVLYQLTSLTLTASEISPGGGIVKHIVPADTLLQSLPVDIRSLTLQGFRLRWKAFHGLSYRPKLVNLNLSGSAFILPAERDWSQLQRLIMADSLIWLEQNQPFQFSLLAQLTVLDLTNCSFRHMDRPQSYALQRIQAPTSIKSLDLLSKSIQVMH